jgi:hypothetical protein
VKKETTLCTSLTLYSRKEVGASADDDLGGRSGGHRGGGGPRSGDGGCACCVALLKQRVGDRIQRATVARKAQPSTAQAAPDDAKWIALRCHGRGPAIYVLAEVRCSTQHSFRRCGRRFRRRGRQRGGGLRKRGEGRRARCAATDEQIPRDIVDSHCVALLDSVLRWSACQDTERVAREGNRHTSFCSKLDKKSRTRYRTRSLSPAARVASVHSTCCGAAATVVGGAVVPRHGFTQSWRICTGTV